MAGPPLREGNGVLRLVRGLLRAITVADVAAVVASRGAEAADAAFANLALFDTASNRARVVLFDPALDPAIAERWSEFPISAQSPVSEAIITGRAVLIESREAMAQRFPTVVAGSTSGQIAAMAALPLVAQHGPMGALVVGWHEAHLFDAHDVVELERLARLVADALERATAQADEQERSAFLREVAADVLQRAFLPVELPSTPDLDVAAAYLPAADAAIGGDWYDIFPAGDRMCLVVGDVSGHGVHGVATMAQLRNAIRAYADEDPSPARVLSRVNRMLYRAGTPETASATIAVWDAATRTLLRSSAGHPPVLRCRRGEFGYLDAPADLILGVEPEWAYRDEPKVMRPGTTIVMYTDGLVEIGAEPVEASMQQLLEMVERLDDLAPRLVCERIVEWRRTKGPRADDLCVLAARLA